MVVITEDWILKRLIWQKDIKDPKMSVRASLKGMSMGLS